MVGTMSLAHYPRAVSADDIIADIEGRRVAEPTSSLGYECLFISTGSTRPAMQYELFPKALSSDDWRAFVVVQVRRAKADARDGEAVYFDPY